MIYNSKISHIETYLPKNKILIGKNLSKDNKRLLKKTGIYKLWISDKNETSLDMGFKSATKLKKKINFEKIDGLIFVSQSSDYFLPSSSCILQDKLGLKKNTFCFDINLGCSGFLYALSVSTSMINSNLANNVLIICSDTYSKFIDKNNMSCKPIFSDGSASIIVSKTKSKLIGKFDFGTDGSGANDLIVKNGSARSNFTNIKKPSIFMNGAKVFNFTIKTIPSSFYRTLKINKLKKDDLNKIFFHQASKFVLDNLNKTLKLKSNQVYSNLKNLGNTVSSTIPFALKEANNKKIIKKNDLIFLSGFGVGLSWSSCVIKWDNLK